MSGPQIIMAGILCLLFLAGFILHGKPRENFHLGYSTADVLILWIVLDQGGFWK